MEPGSHLQKAEGRVWVLDGPSPEATAGTPGEGPLSKFILKPGPDLYPSRTMSTKFQLGHSPCLFRSFT